VAARTAGDRAEALLPRGVPDLQLHPLVVDEHLLDLEVYADGGDEARREGVLGEAQQQAALSHACDAQSGAASDFRGIASSQTAPLPLITRSSCLLSLSM
jgi:hypothetical protein